MSRRFRLVAFLFAIIFAIASPFVGDAFAQTPRLKIKTAHSGPQEEQRKEQMERLAKEYDLKKYTITRNILIDRGAMNHSKPVLTLNLRFLDNDDLALSAYVHEQGHWVLTERGPARNRPLFEDLQRSFPGLSYRVPDGDGEVISSYYHIAVCMLEWHALEDLVGPERARKAMQWKQGDHYKAIYAIDLNQREQVEAIVKRNRVSW